MDCKFMVAATFMAVNMMAQTGQFSSRVPTDRDLPPMTPNCATKLSGAVDAAALSLAVDSSTCFAANQLVTIGSASPYETVQICSIPDSTHLTLCAGTRGLVGAAASHASRQTVAGGLSAYNVNALRVWMQDIASKLGANLANVVKNADPTKTGYSIWQGMTSGSAGLSVADSGADGTLYMLPAANGNGMYLKDVGSATCPTLPSGVTPTACHQLSFIALPSSYATVKANGTAQTQRAALNLIAGSNVGIACSDNSGAGSTDCTVTSSGGGGGSSAKYAASVSGTSTSISAATHGLGSTVVVSGCKDASGAALWPDWSVDSSGNVTVTSAVSQSGTCYIFGQSLYAASISGTSTSITAATHGLGTGVIVSGCKDGSNNSLAPDWSVDGSGNVTITSAVSQAGTCYLR